MTTNMDASDKQDEADPQVICGSSSIIQTGGGKDKWTGVLT
jgi:hypothetical protein